MPLATTKKNIVLWRDRGFSADRAIRGAASGDAVCGAAAHAGGGSFLLVVVLIVSPLVLLRLNASVWAVCGAAAGAGGAAGGREGGRG